VTKSAVVREDNFLSVLNPTGSKLMYSQFIGGHGAENAGGGGINRPPRPGSSTSPPARLQRFQDDQLLGPDLQRRLDWMLYAEKIVIAADLSITKTPARTRQGWQRDPLHHHGPERRAVESHGVMVDDQIGTKSQYVLGAISTTQGACVAQQQNHIVCNLGVMDNASPVNILVHLTPTVLAGGMNTPDFIKKHGDVTANSQIRTRPTTRPKSPSTSNRDPEQVVRRARRPA
jgi:hypothetical protein